MATQPTVTNPDVVLGAPQYPNPEGITPRMDTDNPPANGGTPLTGGARMNIDLATKPTMDVSNPPRARFAVTQAPVPLSPVVVAFPDGSNVRFPSMEHANAHSADVWQQLQDSSAGKFAKGVYSTTLGALADTAHQYWKTTTTPAKEPGANFVSDLATAIVNGHIDQAKKAATAWKEGRLVEAAGHAMGAAVPLVGPAAAAAGEAIGKGNTAEGLGQGAGLVASALLGGKAAEGTDAAETAEVPVHGVKNDIPSKVNPNRNLSLTDAQQRVKALMNETSADAAVSQPAAKAAVKQVEPLSELDRSALATIHKQFGPDTADVQQVGHASTSGPISEARSGSGMEHEAPASGASPEEIHAYIKKAYPSQAGAVLKEDMDVKPISGEELNTTATKAIKAHETQAASKFDYSVDKGDLVNKHSVNITTDGKPSGAVEATAETDNPTSWTIRHSRSQIPGAELGTTAYKKLLDKMQDAADESGQPHTLNGDATQSESAKAVWKKLSNTYDVQRENGRPSITLKPSKVQPAPASEDISNEWQAASDAPVRGNVPLDTPERAAAHELAHHLYAQELGVKSGGIKLGLEPNGSAGRTLLTDGLNEKVRAGTLSNDDIHRAADAYLANGFGEEAALGTPQSEWHDAGDIVFARNMLRDRLGMSDSEIQEFIDTSRAKAQKFFSRPDVKAKIQRAYKPLAANHWNGKATPEQISGYTEEK